MPPLPTLPTLPTLLFWYVAFPLLQYFFSNSSHFYNSPLCAPSPPQQPPNGTGWESLSKHDCLLYGGELVGGTCGYVPDITLMSFILFFGTYACSMALKQFKTSRFFPTTVSGGLGSASVPSDPRQRGKKVQKVDKVVGQR